MPVWIFNNEYDKVWIQEIAIANMKGNPNFKYTIFAGAKGHEAWSKAYSVKGLEEWMSKLDRKNNSDNASSVLAQYKTENKLTPPQVKVEKGQNYLTLAFDPTAEHYGKQQKKRRRTESASFLFPRKIGLLPDFYATDCARRLRIGIVRAEKRRLRAFVRLRQRFYRRRTRLE